MIDCSKEITKFHNEKVTLNQKTQNSMRERRNANRERIKTSLKDDDPQYKKMASQGSYAMYTMIQSDDNDYDIDDGVYFLEDELKDKDDKPMTTDKIKKIICDAVSTENLKEPPTIKKNCIRVQYKAGYHVDIPIYRIVEGNNQKEYYELASTDWKRSDPIAITDWFNNANVSKSPDDKNGRQMRRLVRLLKYFVKNNSWAAKRPSGFLLSVLVVECYSPQAERDDMALYYLLLAIHMRLSHSSKVYNPISKINGELDTSTDNISTIRFREGLKSKLNNLKPTLGNPKASKKDTLEAWGAFFNEKQYFNNLTAEEDDTNSSHNTAPKFDNWESKDDISAVSKKGGGRYA